VKLSLLPIFALFLLPGIAEATGKPPKPIEPPPPPPPPVFALHPDRCASDSWSIKCSDKQAHFAAHVISGVIVADLARDRPYWQRFSIALAPGLAKEIFDDQPGGTGFSWKDMAWNAAGVAVGLQAGGWFISRQQNTTTIGFVREF
jgi:putative lipoprotein